MEDYSIFASPSFDSNAYANAVVAGEPYNSKMALSRSAVTVSSRTPMLAAIPAGQEDISIALAKLNIGIDDISKQLRAVVVAHHEDLLARAAGVSDLEISLQTVRQGLDTIGLSLEKLKTKIRLPHQKLTGNLNRLQRLQIATDALRRVSRFVTLSRRLESQLFEMNRLAKQLSPVEADSRAHKARTIDEPVEGSLDSGGERERIVSQAALNIAELTALIADESNEGDIDTVPSNNISTGVPESLSLSAIGLVMRHLPAIDAARERINAEMENMVLAGLESLNQPMLASALQTAFNLRVLPTLVLTLLTDLTEAVETRVKLAFDVSSLSKDVTSKDIANNGLIYRSRVRTEPTNVTAAQWTNALWVRLEQLVEDMTGCCIKVYVLEKVLRLKKDPTTQVSFLDEVMQTLENKPSSTFWTSLAISLEKHSKEAATSSTFLQQTLSAGYPRFLRLFHSFFAKIAVHTDTVYAEVHQSPETVLVLRAISRFETVYLSRSTARLNETIASALSGGIRSPPGASEGLAIARVAANELDSARFDVLLVRNVARNIVSAVDVLLGRTNTLISRDRMATLLTGQNANPPQILNSQLASTLFACWNHLKPLESEYHSSVVNILTPTLKNLRDTFDRIVDPLLSAIRRDLTAIISRMHRVDFSEERRQDVDLMDSPGGPSGYMKDLVEKLNFVRTQVLGRYNVQELRSEWATSLVKHVVRNFVLHLSITRPLGELGKLQLTSDMAELEFALSAFMVIDDGPTSSPLSPSKGGTRNRNSMRRPVGVKLDSIGDDYKVLRGLRPLLFLDTPLLASPAYTTSVPPLIIIHHILVRSTRPALLLPHALHDWSEAEYIRWTEEHSERERLALIEDCLPKWTAEVRRYTRSSSTKDEEAGEDGIDYILLVKTVLENASTV